MKSRGLVFLGPPASGKGTQGRRLAEENGLAYLSTGALLRRALRDDTDLGKRARPFLDCGEYVPDDGMIPMVLEWLESKTTGGCSMASRALFCKRRLSMKLSNSRPKRLSFMCRMTNFVVAWRVDWSAKIAIASLAKVRGSNVRSAMADWPPGLTMSQRTLRIVFRNTVVSSFRPSPTIVICCAPES